MKSVSLIQNQKSHEWGLSIQEAYLFSFLYELPSWADHIPVKGEIFYFCAKSKIIKELPLLSDKEDTIYRHMKSLKDKGLIDIKKIDKMDYVCLTEKSKSWNKFDGKSDYSEKNPSLLGKFSENYSDLNPTYNNIFSITINNNITKDNIPEFLKNSEKALNSFLKQCFMAKYKLEMSTDFYFSAKEAGKLKPIIQKIVFKMKEKSEKETFTIEEIQSAILFFINAGWSILTDYEKSKYSLTIIDSNFNEIFLKIKNTQNGKQPINTNNKRTPGFRYDVPDPRTGNQTNADL